MSMAPKKTGLLLSYNTYKSLFRQTLPIKTRLPIENVGCFKSSEHHILSAGFYQPTGIQSNRKTPTQDFNYNSKGSYFHQRRIKTTCSKN